MGLLLLRRAELEERGSHLPIGEPGVASGAPVPISASNTTNRSSGVDRHPRPRPATSSEPAALAELHRERAVGRGDPGVLGELRLLGRRPTRRPGPPPGGPAARGTARSPSPANLLASGDEDDLAELAPGGELLVGVGGPRPSGRWRARARGACRRPAVAARGAPSRRATVAFSSSDRARSVEPWMRARLPMSSSRFTSAWAPAPDADDAMRPPMERDRRSAARLGAPTSSSTTSKGPWSSKSAGIDGRRPGERRHLLAPRAGLRTVATTRAPAAIGELHARHAHAAGGAVDAAPTRRPARPHWVKSASNAVVYTSGNPPASGHGTPSGTGRRCRSCTTARSAWAPPPTTAMTRSPMANRLVPGPSASDLAGELHARGCRRASPVAPGRSRPPGGDRRR